MTTPLTDDTNIDLRDIAVHGDIRDDPSWRRLLGAGGKRRTRVRRRKHLPGEHNQQSHAGLDAPGALSDLNVFASDDYADEFGDVFDEQSAGSDGLTVRLFDSGDAHVVLDLDGDRFQPLGELDDAERMRDLAGEISTALRVDVSDVDEDDEDETGLVYTTTDLATGITIGRYATGDVRITPGDTDDYLDITEDDADELVAALLDMAASWDDNFETAGAGEKRRDVVSKHLSGRHNQESHGDGVPGLADPALDKLKLAGRIKLGDGERLAASGSFSGSDRNHPNDAVFAAIDTPGGRQLRLGIVNHEDRRRWSAAKRGSTVLLDDAGISRLDEQMTVVGESVKRTQRELKELADKVDAIEGDWSFDTRNLPDRDRSAMTAEQFHEFLKEAFRFDDSITPEERALIFEMFDREGVQEEGALASGPWGELRYQVRADEELQVHVELGVKPDDAGPNWDFSEITGVEDELRLLPKDLTKFQRAIAEITGHGQKNAAAAKTRSRSMQTKTFRPQVKAVGEGKATFVVATLNEIDKDGDVTLPGFFGRQHLTLVPVHDWNHVPIGKGVLYEQGDTVLVDAKFNLAVPEAKSWYEAIKFDLDNPPALQEYSYGYEILPGGSRTGQKDGRDVRYLTPLPDGKPGVKVFEASPVLLGAGVGTRTVDVKSRSRRRNAMGESPIPATPAVKRAIPVHETAVVSRAWDGAKTEAGLPEDARPSQLRTVYAWVNPDGDSEAKSSYKFPHHHGVDGPANIRACLAGIAALNGARGGTDIPETDRKAVYEHLSAHLRDADREPPELRTDSGESKSLRFGDEAAHVLACVSGLIDRASEVMALRQRKGKGMSANTADLLSWVGDDLTRLHALLSHPVEPETPQPSDDEIASVLAAATARIHGI